MAMLESYRATHEAFRDDARPWLASRRAFALAAFETQGFPTRKDEAWKYTDTTRLAETAFRHASSSALPPGAAKQIDAWRVADAAAELVFVNGRLSAELSRLSDVADGVELGSLQDAAEAGRTGDIVGSIAGDGAPFVALNMAFVQDGLWLRVPRGVDVGLIHVLSVSYADGTPVVSHLRHVVQLAEHGYVSLLQTHTTLHGTAFTNSVVEAEVGPGASLTHHVLDDSGDEGHHVTASHVNVGRDGAYALHSAWLGGALVRNDVRVTLSGEGSSCDLRGVYVLGGDDHIDHHTVIDHAVPRCTSRELFKGVLGGRSTGVFDGLVLVRKDAQHTDSKQRNDNLVLTDDASANSKPTLEIYADDVKCAHGTTVGQLDAEQLAYLRSRGISRDAAAAILTRAFVDELVGAVPHDAVREQVATRTEARLDAVIGEGA